MNAKVFNFKKSLDTNAFNQKKIDSSFCIPLGVAMEKGYLYKSIRYIDTSIIWGNKNSNYILNIDCTYKIPLSEYKYYLNQKKQFATINQSFIKHLLTIDPTFKNKSFSYNKESRIFHWRMIKYFRSSLGIEQLSLRKTIEKQTELYSFCWFLLAHFYTLSKKNNQYFNSKNFRNDEIDREIFCSSIRCETFYTKDKDLIKKIKQIIPILKAKRIRCPKIIDGIP